MWSSCRVRAAALIAVGFLLTGCGSDEGPAVAAEPQERVMVHPSRLAGDFAADEVEAERNYEGVEIVTSGHLTKVERSLTGVNLVVEDRVGCWLYGVWEDDDLAALEVGERVTLRGVGATRNVSRVELHDCSPSPAGSLADGPGEYVCPMEEPYSLTDTWGTPRVGGGTHQGIDMIAPRGAPISAVTDGTVEIKGYGSRFGYWLILRGEDGSDYLYAYLGGYAVESGPVSAGQVIAHNGDTGDARGTPHLHFELHPGGGEPVNPYPFLREVCD
jgi:murein DD-endopeptidase MepM/ murein hydrolase activator NlpD